MSSFIPKQKEKELAQDKHETIVANRTDSIEL